MEISISEQALEFLLSCLLGAVLGVLYDAFRILRAAIPHGRILTLLEDILFWALSAVITFFFLLLFSEGQVRLYILLGELLGFIVYYFTVGSLVIGASKWIIRQVKRFLRFLYRLFIRPFVRPFSFIFRKFRQGFVHISLNCKKLGQNRKKHLQNQSDLLYNQNSTINISNDKPIARKRKHLYQTKKKVSKKDCKKWLKEKRKEISC